MRRANKAKIVVGMMILFLGGAMPVNAAGQLHISGSNWVDASGNRFVAKGVNIEAYRDLGCGYISDNGYAQRTAMASALKNYGVNAVRLTYSAQNLSSSLNNYLDIMQAFTSQGIYVMPSDFALDNDLTKRNNGISYPMFKKIINGARQRGIDSYLIMNPFNEPANISWDNWVTINKEILSVLRAPDTAASYTGYTGIVMFDTPNWASDTDSSTGYSKYKAIVDYDAGLLGGKANVGFSNHYYPNHPYGQGHLDAAIKAASTYAVIVGELGQINPGVTGIEPNFVISSLNTEVSSGIPAGHNGIFGWMWVWCDENNMTLSESNFTTVNPEYGQLYKDYYWSKLGTPSVTVGTDRPGDANKDGKVDDLDYLIWATNYGVSGTGATWAKGNFNADTVIDDLDYLIWAKNYS